MAFSALRKAAAGKINDREGCRWINHTHESRMGGVETNSLGRTVSLAKGGGVFRWPMATGTERGKELRGEGDAAQYEQRPLARRVGGACAGRMTRGWK